MGAATVTLGRSIVTPTTAASIVAITQPPGPGGAGTTGNNSWRSIGVEEMVMISTESYCQRYSQENSEWPKTMIIISTTGASTITPRQTESPVCGWGDDGERGEEPKVSIRW